ncbi:hypothetical protein PV325_002858 [Microctonus aethiopoides]|uniref:Protein eyes shut n=1 Tax=Microctonus aethiopoides TaxID=144406 RepID=A0AA39FLV4_9HYME|nr:hypothetical protein PV325_002858 [Microctonus aethiopoides]KAK0172019.1 hypothetical protein PV328_005394 [Microctonus aethiopoides]
MSSALNCTNDPCMYGICLDNSDNSYSCYCIDGYTGINCEINWDECWSNPCLNGGTCNDAVAAYNCTCTDGFIGINCEIKYSECLNQPCLNNGTCIDYNGFTCQCPEGYSGDYCEIDVSICNSTICKNGGECVDGPGYSFNCHCRDGWTGELCEEDIDECLSSPCHNGGLCLNVPASYTCACLFGFTGKDCDKIIVACNDNPCQNNAMCLLEDSQPICYCVPDYHGQFCEMQYNDCESKFVQCQNGGTCIDGINDFTCACPAPYGGSLCLVYNPTSTVSTFHEKNSTEFIDIFTTQIMTTTITTNQQSSSQLTVNNSNEPVTTSGKQFFDESTTKQTPIIFEKPNSTIYSLTIGDTETLMTSVDDESSSEKFTTVPPLFTTKNTLSTTFAEKSTTAFDNLITTVFQIYTTSVKPSAQFFTTETSLDTSTAKSPIILPSNETSTLVLNRTMTTTPITWIMKTTEETAGNFTSPHITSTLTDDKSPRFFTSIPFSTSSPRKDLFDKTPITSSSSSSVDFSMTTLNELTSKEKPQTTTSTMITYSIDQTEVQEHSTNYNCTSTNCNLPATPTIGTINNAAFNGKSYVRQQIMIDDNGILKIYLRLKTKAKSGIVMHAFFDEERYVLLYMELGQLKFQFSCGLQTMLLGEIDTPINNGHYVDVEMKFKYTVENEIGQCSASLFVNGTMAMSGEQMLSAHEDIPQQVRLHLGGIPQAFSHYFPRIAMGFIGCMNLLKVNDIQRHFIRDSTETFQIEECVSFLCLLNPCRNFGACHDINGKAYCKCIPGYTGEICEKTACDENPCYLGATCISSPGTGFICICPLGMHGLRCEEESIIVQPSFSVFIPGFSSYAAYGINTPIKDNMELKMRILPHSVDQISLIAFMGQSGSSQDISDHFSLTYVKGYIMLTWDLGSGVRRIFTKSPLSTRLHKAHTVLVGRRGRDAWLYVDGIGNVTGQAAGTMTQLDVSPVLYVGGHKSKNFETLPHDLPLHTGFTGCIFEIELRTNVGVFPITRSNPASGRGVGECHRNECTHNSCKNGAVCLNHGPTYSCICMKEWEGPECSVSSFSCSSSNPLCHNKINI